MPDWTQCRIALPSGIGLRSELRLRGLRYALAYGYLHERTDGPVPGIIFGRDASGRHGNFHLYSHARICTNTEWARQLEKVHGVEEDARAFRLAVASLAGTGIRSPHRSSGFPATEVRDLLGTSGRTPLR